MEVEEELMTTSSLGKANFRVTKTKLINNCYATSLIFSSSPQTGSYFAEYKEKIVQQNDVIKNSYDTQYGVFLTYLSSFFVILFICILFVEHFSTQKLESVSKNLQKMKYSLLFE